MQPDQIRKLGRIAAMVYLAMAVLWGVTVLVYYLSLRWPLIVYSSWSIYLPFAISALILRAAYLGWFRWSPLAVRHLLSWPFAFLTIALLTFSFAALNLLRAPLTPFEFMVAGFPVIAIIFSYWSYRRTSRRVSDRAFPAT